MSGVISAGQESRERDGSAVDAAAAGARRRRRRRWAAVGLVVVVVVLAVEGAVTGGFGRGGKPPASNPYPVSTATVTAGSLTEQTQVDGTLGDAGSYTVVNQAPGTITALPAVGQVVRQGQILYQVSGDPVLLLYGSVPAYRALSEGMTGRDVTELNSDLVALGYANSGYVAELGWDYFGWDTRYALEQLQQNLGETETGVLALGQAVFLPGAIRVSGLGQGTTLGGTAGPGAALLTAVSTTPQVTVDLDPGLQTEVKAGDKVAVTLPSGGTTPGVISSVGTVASSRSSTSSGGSSGSSSSNDSSNSSGATIPVEVSLSDPKAAGGLTSAPVTVTITTASVSNALIVPVTALLAQSGGGYAVEVTGPGGHHVVAVTPGLFDDANGKIQVTGSGLAAGDQVVVAGS